MAGKAEHRKAKARLKKKKKRDKASRPGRNPGQSGTKLRKQDAVNWAVGDGWINEDWAEPGADIAAVLTRTSSDDKTLMVGFQGDLAGGGITDISEQWLTHPDGVQAWCAQAGDALGQSMVSVTPTLAKQAVVKAAAYAGSDNPQLAEALTWFQDIDESESPMPVIPQPKPPKKEKKAKLIWRLLGLD